MDVDGNCVGAELKAITITVPPSHRLVISIYAGGVFLWALFGGLVIFYAIQSDGDNVDEICSNSQELLHALMAWCL